MLWVKKLSEEINTAIHGVDYHKGLKGGKICGRVHKYDTKNCQVVIYTDDDRYGNLENYIPYTNLSDREILTLGNPILFNSLRAY